VESGTEQRLVYSLPLQWRAAPITFSQPFVVGKEETCCRSMHGDFPSDDPLVWRSKPRRSCGMTCLPKALFSKRCRTCSRLSEGDIWVYTKDVSTPRPHLGILRA